jgi:signal transduction histidine kinase
MQKNVLVIEGNPDIANLVMINLRGKQLQVDHAADGDIGMMQRVLENLLENGLRHTPSGGRVSINVDLDSTNVAVRIADTGCGIPPEDIPRIFERFYQRPIKSL